MLWHEQMLLKAAALRHSIPRIILVKLRKLENIYSLVENLGFIAILDNLFSSKTLSSLALLKSHSVFECNFFNRVWKYWNNNQKKVIMVFCFLIDVSVCTGGTCLCNWVCRPRQIPFYSDMFLEPWEDKKTLSDFDILENIKSFLVLDYMWPENWTQDLRTPL